MSTKQRTAENFPRMNRRCERRLYRRGLAHISRETGIPAREIDCVVDKITKMLKSLQEPMQLFADGARDAAEALMLFVDSINDLDRDRMKADEQKWVNEEFNRIVERDNWS